MAWMDIGDVQLFFTDDGTGDPVLFVHGWACDSHDWSHQIARFARSHRVIAVDLRGHGRSSVPAGGYLPRQFAADLSVLLERLGAGPVVAIGHSLGGVVASVLAVERPDLVRAVVAIDPAYALSPSISDRILANVRAFREPEGHLRAAEAQRAMSTPSTPEYLVTWHGRRVLGTPAQVVAETYAGLYEPDDQVGLDPASSEYLRGRIQPVLAFYVMPRRAEHERGLSDHPRSHVVSREGAGHWLHQERPAEFNASVLDWIATLD